VKLVVDYMSFYTCMQTLGMWRYFVGWLLQTKMDTFVWGY